MNPNPTATTTPSEWGNKMDDELLERIARGTDDEQRIAFDTFYSRHQEYFFGMCYQVANRYKSGAFDHEDLFQESMIKARKHAHTFCSEGITDPEELEDKADAWLGTIAENVAIDLIRRKPKCVPFDPQWTGGEDEESDEDEALAVHDGAIDFDQATDWILIREAIATLSPAQQTVVWAISQFYERREHQRTPTEALDEIVEALGITRENFRKHKERARKAILKYLENHKSPPLAK